MKTEIASVWDRAGLNCVFFFPLCRTMMPFPPDFPLGCFGVVALLHGVKLSLFSLPVTVLLPTLTTFNVDEKNGLAFNGPIEDLFGYTVQQFENEEGKW